LPAVERQIQSLVDRKMLSPQQAKMVDRPSIHWMLQSEVGSLLAKHHANLLREIPFAVATPSSLISFPVTPGEGKGASRWRENAGSRASSTREMHPHPNPPPEYMERGKSEKPESPPPLTPSPCTPGEAGGEGSLLDALMVRGRIDLLVPTDAGLLLVDYKTDNVTGDQLAERTESYKQQMNWYRDALEKIARAKITGMYLVFLKPQRIMKL
jgi:hypothetical protein